ncbi:hypothetical protein L1987_84270 [Smallanthus sonchifolius]|uniref:Uncharacterized protein n=1 Tax=Smallanthus sonchifolius TaxID=185202 RepID=A0ACB8YFF8_9ASTR|nr:hypothetical protein L1987_84270 [Smallanthus sonchifolius]
MIEGIGLNYLRYDMMGLIIFGPEKGRSVLRVRGDPDYEKLQLGEDFSQCFGNTILFRSEMSKNPSLGLCECDDWRSIENVSRDSLLSPYEQRFVDVKFDRGVYAVTLKCHIIINCAMYILNENVADDGRVVNWAVRAIAVFAIFDSSFDTPLAIVAVVFCLALNYVLSFVISSGTNLKLEILTYNQYGAIVIQCRALIFKKTKLQWVKLREYLTRDDSVAEWEKYPEGWTRDLVVRWASAPGFREWVIKNQDRIIVIKDD